MKYKVNCGGANKFYGIKEEYNAGETVSLKIPFVTDTDTTVKSDDVKLINVTGDSRYYEYEFVMPEKDVNITVKNTGSMMNAINPRLRDEPVAMGSMMMGMMNNPFAVKKPGAFRVYCNMLNSMLGMDDCYLPNDMVVFSFLRATDTSYQIKSDDVEITWDDSAGGYIRGSFIMPGHDVNISISSRNIMNMSDGQKETKNSDVAEGEMQVCPCCNEISNPTAKFCSNCGAALK